MTDSFDVVVIGAGIGGITAAETVLERSATTRVALINGEDCVPYDRPPLSKDLLAGQVQAADIPLLSPDWQASPRLQIRQGESVQGIDRSTRTLTLASGKHLRYDRLILATGCRPRHLAATLVDPACSERIVYLRTLDDALRLKAHLASTPRPALAIIGAGFIGLEVAATARQAGCPVTVLEAGSRVLGRGAPAAVSDFVRARHEQAGVTFTLDARLQRISPDGGAVSVQLDDGRSICADIVVAGIGALPNDELARTAGLACDDGILVDAGCRTSDASILAVGDAIRLQRLAHERGERIEHWSAARRMGQIAGANACGADETYDEVPWVWSDHYDLNLQFLGHSAPDHRHVIRGDATSSRWAVLEVQGERLAAATLINMGKERRTVERLIAGAIPVPVDVLGDSTTTLKSLLDTAR